MRMERKKELNKKGMNCLCGWFSSPLFLPFFLLLSLSFSLSSISFQLFSVGSVLCLRFKTDSFGVGKERFSPASCDPVEEYYNV